MPFTCRKKELCMYSKDVSRICQLCVSAKKLASRDEYMCCIHGIVEANYQCNRFKYNILARQPRRKRDVKDLGFTQGDFSIE